MSHVGSTICAIQLARECSKAGSRIQWLRASWAGALQPQSEWQSDMVTLGKRLICRRSRTSKEQQAKQDALRTRNMRDWSWAKRDACLWIVALSRRNLRSTP